MMLTHDPTEEKIMTGNILICTLTALLLASCGRGDLEIRSYDVAKAVAKPRMADPMTQAVAQNSDVVPPTAEATSDVRWDTPSGWKPGAASGMRVASFATAGNGDASIVVLTGEAGGLVANVNRWRGQIGLAAETQDAIAAEAKPGKGSHGDFKWFRLLGGDQAILAAIIAKPGKSIFVKLTGSRAVLDTNQEKFLTLCRSIRVAAQP